MAQKKDPDEAEIEQLRRELRPTIAQIDPAYYGEILEKLEATLKKIGRKPTLTFDQGRRYEEE